MVKYRRIPPAAATNQIAGNARIPPAPDLQKNKLKIFFRSNYCCVFDTVEALFY